MLIAQRRTFPRQIDLKGGKQMKEIYEEPQITIISFETTDIITTSSGDDIGEWDF